MANLINNWGTKEWETHSKLLVSQHHGMSNVINVPDNHKGDFGIECFTVAGDVYQMYAAQNVFDVAKLYEKQRNKINLDINKFINNQADLEKLFGDTKIRRWVLLVPKNVSSKLVQYANSKTEEVKKKKLSYVADDFKILIKDEDDFLPEKKQLINNGSLLYKHPEIEISEQDLQDFDDKESESISNLKTKLVDNHGLDNDKYEEVKDLLIKEFIQGSNIISNLHTDYPELWNELVSIKRVRERSLIIESIQGNTDLAEEIEKITSKFSALNKLHNETVHHLAYEAISDWLMRCPLDFKQNQ